MLKADSIRQAILGARDFRKKAVAVPEWGLETGLFVRSLSLSQAVEFNTVNGSLADDNDSVPLYLAYTLCDEDGERIFADPTAGVEALRDKDQEVITRVFGEALKINNDGSADAGEAEVKN